MVATERFCIHKHQYLSAKATTAAVHRIQWLYPKKWQHKIIQYKLKSVPEYQRQKRKRMCIFVKGAGRKDESIRKL